MAREQENLQVVCILHTNAINLSFFVRTTINNCPYMGTILSGQTHAQALKLMTLIGIAARVLEFKIINKINDLNTE
jgi:hypothetical protein